MPNAAPRLATPTILTLLQCVAIAQEPPVRFVLKGTPVVRVAVHDAPGFVAAIEKGKLGKLIAEPEFADAFASGVERFRAATQRWCNSLTALERLDANAVDWPLQVQRELWSIDWRDAKGGQLVASRVEGANAGRFQTTMLLEPTPAAEGRLSKRFTELADHVWKHFDATEPPPETKIDGFPARIAIGAAGQDHDAGIDVSGAWFVHLPGQFAAGNGDPTNAGQCRAAPVEPPSVALELDIGAYLGLMAGFMGQAPFAKPMEALGVGEVCRFAWQVAPRGELLQDDVTLELGKLEGVFAALVHAAAPLVDQPLPEGGLLQLRCAFDVRELITVVDTLLANEGQPTLTALGVAEDLNKAWSGGLAIGVCAPAGSLVPRVFVSLGIVDEAALERLLIRLVTASGFEKKEIEFEGQKCAQMKIPGAPAAVAPTWCVQGGAIHFAESGGSMRALLKAVSAKTPRALDVGDTPRPDGKGAIVPGFDLRYDAAAMYTAFRDTWLPALELANGVRRAGDEPLVMRKDMPEARTMAAHLGRGRGVLRHLPDRLVLSMNGTTGGPFLLGFLATCGPMWSASVVSSWQWSADSTIEQIKRIQLERAHAAIEAFTKRTGKRPESLADLIGTEITDATLLCVDGDPATEPLLRDGKEVARTSFRYYRDGVEVTPSGEQVKVHLIAITPGRWTRLAIGLDGSVHEGYGEFVTAKIDDFATK